MRMYSNTQKDIKMMFELSLFSSQGPQITVSVILNPRLKHLSALLKFNINTN